MQGLGGLLWPSQGLLRRGSAGPQNPGAQERRHPYTHTHLLSCPVTVTDGQGLVRAALAAPFLPDAVHSWGAGGAPEPGPLTVARGSRRTSAP